MQQYENNHVSCLTLYRMSAGSTRTTWEELGSQFGEPDKPSDGTYVMVSMLL